MPVVYSESSPGREELILAHLPQVQLLAYRLHCKLWLSQTPYAGKLPVQARPSWFGSKQRGCVGPGLVSPLESIVWIECENEVEILQ